jgi:hypothetical protein
MSAPETVASAAAKPVMAAMDTAASLMGRATNAVSRGASSAVSGAGAAVDALDPDLVSIVSPRGGAALRKAQQIREAVQKAATSRAETASGGTPPPVGPLAEPVQVARPAMSPQQQLNEEALARRQEAYQARQTEARSAPAPASTETAAKPAMTAPEVKEYLRLRVAGKTDQQAKAAILAGRAMNEQYGLKVPTNAETKFPKGQRGGTQPLKPLP